MENRFHHLIEIIHHKFGCEAQWLRSERVRQEWRGQTVWEGDVQVFAVKGCPTAEIAYAWSWQTEHGSARSTAILNEGPVMSASDAVRSATAVGYEQGEQQPPR